MEGDDGEEAYLAGMVSVTAREGAAIALDSDESPERGLPDVGGRG